MGFDELMLLIDYGFLLDLATALTPLPLLNKVNNTGPQGTGLLEKWEVQLGKALSVSSVSFCQLYLRIGATDKESVMFQSLGIER